MRLDFDVCVGDSTPVCHKLVFTQWMGTMVKMRRRRFPVVARGLLWACHRTACVERKG